jgi:hypothetical protein
VTEIDRDLLKILVCPQSRAAVVQIGDWLVSTDPQTRRKYPIRDGIPIMLIDESVEADPAEVDQARTAAQRRETTSA